MKKCIIFVGPPGCGKGSQADSLVSQYGYTHICSGSLLRDSITKKTQLGEIAKTYIHDGELVPDELIISMIGQHIQSQETSNTCIMDGFPRTLVQAHSFSDIVRDMKLCVIEFAIDSEIVTERILNRLLCKKCAKPYHAQFAPPKQKGVCDSCHGPLYKRGDDTAPVIKKRLSVYQAQTKPLIEFYAKKNVLHTIDASKEFRAVQKEITKIVFTL